MRYTVLIRRTAEKEFAFESANPGARGRSKTERSEKLSNRSEYRLRVGDYRILYTVDDAARIVEIIAVGRRGEVYR